MCTNSLFTIIMMSYR